MKKFLASHKACAALPEQRANSRGWSDSEVFWRVAVVISVVIATVAVSLAAPNILVNGGFEDNPPTAADTPWINPPSALGNHQGYSIAPWVLGAGQVANVVTVDGVTPISTTGTEPQTPPPPKNRGNYGHDGPHVDASGAPNGVEQHYLDITNGGNDFYQSFTPQCSGEVDFGGFFSTRGINFQGKASVRIVQGVGTAGQVVGATNQINLPLTNQTGDPVQDGWTPVSYTVSVIAGTTYSFVVSMDDNMNFDEGFVRYRLDCSQITPTPTPTPGCAQVTAKDVRCESNGSYSYSFSVTNGTGKDVTQILLTPVQGSSFKFSQQLFHLSQALHGGQSATLTVKIGDMKPGAGVCFFVCLMPKDAPCCIVKVCPTLPDCGGDKSPTPTPARRR